MSTIIKMLDEMTDTAPPTEAYWQAQEKCRLYWDAVRKAFSSRFADDMYDAEVDVWLTECDEHFARGCRLGAQLMMELLSPGASGSPDTRRRSSSGPRSGRPR